MAILNYNNRIYSPHDYNPFLLNYQLNFGINLNQKQTDYVHELTETFKELNQYLNLIKGKTIVENTKKPSKQLNPKYKLRLVVLLLSFHANCGCQNLNE